MNDILFKELVEKANILSNVSTGKFPALVKRGLNFATVGDSEINDNKAKIAVGVTDKFPYSLPMFFLLNKDDFDPIPHVEDDGFICYTHDDSVVLDINNPIGIICDCFAIASRTLQNGIDKLNGDDFYNEYEAYWNRLKNVEGLFTNICIGSEVKLLKWTKSKRKDFLFAVSDETERINSYQRLFDAKDNPAQYFNGVFIPLTPLSKILIPKGSHELKLCDIQEIIFKNVTPENQKKLHAILAKTKQEDLFVFDLPQPNGHHSLFAVRFKGISHAKHPIFTPGAKANLIPLSVKRLDAEFMLARGGIGQNFINNKVLVIGAGSVGGSICEELIKATILNVDVVDKEILDPENCYRHNCGYKYAMKTKAEAIKAKLQSFYPHAKINAISLPIEEVIQKKKVDFKSYDAIIVATGNATVNQFLMRFFKDSIFKKPVLFSWLDPFGIGGHCLVTNISVTGCYQCLYSNEKLHNIASFADAIQNKSFSKNISGCGSVYVPYGSLDANQTAILTVRKLLDFLGSKESENSIYSWKGNSDLFIAAGYNLSSRYFQVEGELLENKHRFHQSNCELCGK